MGKPPSQNPKENPGPKLLLVWVPEWLSRFPRACATAFLAPAALNRGQLSAGPTALAAVCTKGKTHKLISWLSREAAAERGVSWACCHLGTSHDRMVVAHLDLSLQLCVSSPGPITHGLSHGELSRPWPQTHVHQSLACLFGNTARPSCRDPVRQDNDKIRILGVFVPCLCDWNFCVYICIWFLLSLSCAIGSATTVRKILAPIKNKIGTSPPKKKTQNTTPPQTEEFYGHGFYLQKERISYRRP